MKFKFNAKEGLLFTLFGFSAFMSIIGFMWLMKEIARDPHGAIVLPIFILELFLIGSIRRKA